MKVEYLLIMFAAQRKIVGSSQRIS